MLSLTCRILLIEYFVILQMQLRRPMKLCWRRTRDCDSSLMTYGYVVLQIKHSTTTDIPGNIVQPQI